MQARNTERSPLTWRPWCVLAIGGVLLLASSSTAAEPRATQDRLQEFLSSGEFAPARQLAEQTPDIGQRDQLLARVAQAQAQAGASAAARQTAAAINNDVTRNVALNESGPFGKRGAGGGNQADFDSLIELITTTIAPTSWDEVGGPGSVAPYQNGVYVDAENVLRHAVQANNAGGADALAALRLAALDANDNTEVARKSPLRKVSLTRLEKQLQLLRAAGRKPPEDMAMLAGLEKIKYVLVYPDSGDIVLAGPAGAWKTDDEGRVVSRDSGRPVLRLDDFVTVLRHLTGTRDARFGCSITPSQESLANTKAFLEQSSKTPLKPGQREAWLKTLRNKMGRQNIEFYGLDPQTRVAHVLIEADYRMKLVGMGLEPGVMGVTNYLDMIHVKPGQSPPPMDVLRWWFTLNYQSVDTTADRDAYEIKGQGVQVLSENEMLTALGERVHTGASQPLNQEFAHSFTQHFDALAKKYPIYADLQNVFDLALVCAVIKTDDLPARVGWHLTCFRDARQYPVDQTPAATTVETVIRHRVINQKHVIAGVSGGVRVDPWKLVEAGAVKVDTYGVLKAERKSAAPANLAHDAWWWD